MDMSEAAATEWRSQDALVVGRLGGRVELECGAADPGLSGNDGDEPSLLLWFHESRPATPLYSVDGRRTGGSGMAGAQHSMSDVWAGRSYFSSVSRTLRLEDLAADDQGRYRCRVDFRRGRTRTSTLTLVVREEPHNVTIGDEHGVEMRGTVGPFNEGDSLAIVCTAHGRPPPELSWWQETRLLRDNNSSGTADEAVSRSALRIEALERSHLMARIRCKARSGDQEEEASVALDMNLRPLGVSVAAPARALVAEQPAQFRCDSWGSRPPANLTWWKGSRRMTRSLATVDESSGRTTSVLAFTPGGDDHGRRLRCRAANDRVPGSEIEDALKLEVEFAPSVRLQLAGGSAVNEGGDARFECSVRAHPEPSEPPRWLWEGRPVSTLSGRGAGSGGQHRLESNGSLHILTLLNVQRWQQGRYACLAHNARGKALSAHVILLVRYAPRCVPNQRREYQAALHQALLVRCRVEAEPAAPTLFSWTFSSGPHEQPLTLLDHSRAAGGLESLVRYVPRSELDYGTLACLAGNPVGTARAPCFFTVRAPAPRCRLAHPGPRLVCVPATPLGEDSSMVVQLRDARGLLRASLRSTQPVFMLNGLAFHRHLLATAFVVSATGQRSASSAPILLTPASLEDQRVQTAVNHAAEVRVRSIVLPLISIILYEEIYSFLPG
ncbi:nephrin-like [Haemaphysalis longicornis]